MAYYKIARAFVDREPSGNVTRDHVLGNNTAYWLTGSAASAARSSRSGARRSIGADLADRVQEDFKRRPSDNAAS